MRKFYNMKLRLAFYFLIIIAPNLLTAQICTTPTRQTQLNKFLNNNTEQLSLTNEINISASFVDLSRPDGSDYFEDIIISLDGKSMLAEQASYFPQTNTAEIAGNVNYLDNNIFIASEYAEINTADQEVRFLETTFDLLNPYAYGQAGSLVVSRSGDINISDVFFTTCGEENPFWAITSSNLHLDPELGVGSARQLSLRIKGVPVLYLPTLTFPISSNRKSGFLMPEFNNSQKLGRSIVIPYYFNLAPNFDAILSPGYHTEVGSSINSEIRYLNELGTIDSKFYAISDKNANTNRYSGEIELDFQFPNQMRLSGAGRFLSDSYFYEDFLYSRELASETHYVNQLTLAGGNTNIYFTAGVQKIHLMDTENVSNHNNIQLSPTFMLYGFKNIRGFFFESYNELAQFDQFEKTTRFDSIQSLEAAFNLASINIKPRIDLRHTSYKINEDTISRTIPTISIDSTMLFERVLSGTNNYIQTLEPRVMYIWSDEEIQGTLPLYDTLIPDLNITSFFHPYRYVGADRVLPRNDWIVAGTSRLLDATNGRELLSATMAIAKSNVASEAISSSDVLGNNYILEVTSQIANLVQAQISRRWNRDDTSLDHLLVRLIYRPNSESLLSIGYTERTNLIDQLNTTLIVPLFNGNFFSKLSYSVKDDDILENRFGWQYNGCCWGLGIEYYDYVSRRSGEHDQGFKVQFFLNGLINNRLNSIDGILQGGLLQ